MTLNGINVGLGWCPWNVEVIPPDIALDGKEQSWKELTVIIKKVWSGSATGPNGVTYKTIGQFRTIPLLNLEENIFLSLLAIKILWEYMVREHPFNLKGGLWFFSESKYFFLALLRSRTFFREKLSRHYFFSTKTIIFKPQSANRIFFSAHFKDRFFFLNQICQQKIFPQKKP